VTGLLVVASARVEFTQGRITRMTQFGIVVRDLPPSSAIRINRSAFEDNGFIDVRTQTTDRNAFHSHVTVEDNTMHGTTYGVAFANCGGSSGTACVARNNQMKPKRSDPGTGLDLNRSHHAIVTGNRVLGLGDTCAPGVTCRCGYGFTIDDTQNATITGNTVEGCTKDGILLGNGAVAENRPWYVSGNTVADNTIRGNSGLGLAAFRNPTDAMDNNMFNVFRNNRIDGNASGGCATNGVSNSFFGNGPQPCLAQGVSTGSSAHVGTSHGGHVVRFLHEVGILEADRRARPGRSGRRHNGEAVADIIDSPVHQLLADARETRTSALDGHAVGRHARGAPVRIDDAGVKRSSAGILHRAEIRMMNERHTRRLQHARELAQVRGDDVVLRVDQRIE
jgi:hypothetical protein